MPGGERLRCVRVRNTCGSLRWNINSEALKEKAHYSLIATPPAGPEGTAAARRRFKERRGVQCRRRYGIPPQATVHKTSQTQHSSETAGIYLFIYL